MSKDRINGYVVNAAPDLPDIRDWPYQPALVNLARRVDPPRNLAILDQKGEGACTGFGLAAVINYLNQQRQEAHKRVSPRMLYEMARRHDEWEGERYTGSSCRGAIKGWYHTGVAEERLWKYVPGRPGHLTVDAAKNARNTTIGAYYRLAHRISDFHAALNETQVLYCSARVHGGWASPEDGVIQRREDTTGRHAFAVVGYDERGFWVQNSWGDGWGEGGLAIWTYEDWQRNVQDAWVLRLALTTPQVWHHPKLGERPLSARVQDRPAPVRGDIAGHFVHIDDGAFHETGTYWSSLDDVRETAALLETSVKYDHLLLYAHGGLNSPKASAKRIFAMKDVFKENRVYPYHFMYDTGILEELKDVVIGKRSETVERAGDVTDASDWLLEQATRIPGRALWREMKRGARSPFNVNGAGTRTLKPLLDALEKNNGDRSGGDLPPITLHLVGHSTGAILLGWLLARLAKLGRRPKPRIGTVHLLAPAASIDFYRDTYVPRLGANATGAVVQALRVLNLNDALERDDSVGPYRKSLLYLVSRAFEERRRERLLGMVRYAGEVPPNPALELITSAGPNGDETRTRAETHGEFDNDVATMNTVLADILGQAPNRPFTSEDLGY
ncbi:MAG: C1 family peptidase [Xanthomonadales bacterium]|jgi:hypothetical protein|nr:C1 family peptidase [Xanthomonadales bacterium]